MTSAVRGPREGLGPMVWCIAAAALFGVSTPASKGLLDSVGPMVFAGTLYLGAAVAVAPWALKGWRRLRTIDRKSRWRLAGAVLFGGIIGPVLLLTGLKLASAGSVAIWLNMETVATAVLGHLWFKEHLGPRTWLAVGVVVLASLILSGSTLDGGPALIFVALAGAAWGLDNNFTALIDGFTPSETTFVKGLIAGTFNLVVGLSVASEPVAAGPFGIGMVIGGVCYGASLILYVGASQQLGATRSQLVFSTAPAWGLVAAWVVLGEAVEPAQVLAATLMTGAMWLWHREQHSHMHRHQPLQHTHRHRHDDGHHDDHTHAPLDVVPAGHWHSHPHSHVSIEHAHPHRPDLHHRHDHPDVGPASDDAPA